MRLGPGEQLLKHLGCFWSWDLVLYLRGHRLLLQITLHQLAGLPDPVRDVCPKVLL